MRYLGGKGRTGKEIATVLRSLRTPGQVYLEPFVGAANVVVHVPAEDGPRLASDLDPELVALWQRAQAGWVPPADVSEQFYGQARNDNALEPAVRGFVKVACSYAGKPWGGYARDRKGGRNFADEGSRSVARYAARLDGVEFRACAYDAWQPSGWLVYCDPPYAGTTGYRVAFDNERFWATMRRWSLTNTVIVSEYQAPDDFACIWERPFTRGLDDKRITERLFRYAPAVANDNG